jgi:hypothetical protein
MRVRASVGRPGASAHAEYRRRQATERARWARGLPWRVAAVLAAGVTPGLLAAQVTPDLAGLMAVAATVGLGWRLWFRPSTDTLAWRRGAAGERRTARLLSPLERRGWAVLHDLAVPGTQANLDHLVLGIADVQVAAIVAVHSAGVPWGLVRAEGVTIVPARRVPDLLQALPPRLGPEPGRLAGRPSPAAVPSRRLTACHGSPRRARASSSKPGTAPERRLRGGVAAVDDDLGEPAPHDGL